MNYQQRRRNTSSMRKVFEIPKGPTGYGITLVGEKPCTVSGVCRDGNAYREGVRNRDEIIRLFGKDVSEASHENVAYMIGTSTGVLLLEVYRRKVESNLFANDNLKSSQHHSLSGRLSPKAKMHQCTTGVALRESQNSQRNNKYASHQPRKIYHRLADDLKHSTLNHRLMHLDNVENVNLQLHSDHNAKYESRHAKRTKHTIVSREVRLSAQAGTCFQKRLLQTEIKGRNYESLSNEGKSKLDVRRVVGFVGSLKINTDPGDPSQRLKIVSEAVCHIQSFPRRFTPVLLVVNIDRMLVLNSHGSTVLVYPTYCVRFWSLCPTNKNQFVLVTQELRRFNDNDILREIVETLCHVYVVDPMFSDHDAHSRIAREFGIRCALGMEEDGCLEFPKSASEVIESVGNAYRQNLDIPLTASGTCFPNLLMSLPSDYSEQPDPLGNVNCQNRVCIFDANSAAVDEERKELDISPVESSRLNAFVDPRIDCLDQRLDQSFDSVASSSDSQISLILSSQSSFICDSLGKQTSIIQLPKLQGHHETPIANAMTETPEPEVRYNDSFRTNSTHICDCKLVTAKDCDEQAVAKRSLECVSSSCSGNSYTGSIMSPSSAPPPLPPRRKCVPHFSIAGKLLDNSGSKRSCMNPAMVPWLLNKHLSNPGFARAVGNAKSSILFDAAVELKNTNSTDLSDKKRQTARRSVSAVHGSKIQSEFTKAKVKQTLLDPQLSRKDLRLSSHDDSQLSNTSKDKRRFSEGISGLRLSAVNLLKGGSFKDLKTVARKLDDHNMHSQRERISSDRTASSSAVPKAVEQSAEVVELGRASRWATSFDKLLSDKAGIATFMEFLRREYCQESLVFWLKCEDYRKLNAAQCKTRAAELFAVHISPEANEQVNVTGVIEKDIENNMESATSTLFDAAQKHVYLLMKQDKYGRFLKSDLYQQAVLAEIDGKAFPFTGEPEVKQKSAVAKRTDKEDGNKKRRSLIFWSKKKFAKSSTNADVRASTLWESSKALSSAEDEGHQRLEETMCHVVLVTGSVVPLVCSVGQTIAQTLGKLGDGIKPGLVFYKVVDSVTEMSIDATKDASTIVGRKLCLNRCIVFRLGLGPKILAVRADPAICVKDLLGPVLLKYGFIFDRTVIHIVGTGVILNGNTQADSLNCKSVLAQSMDNFRASDEQDNDWNTNNRRPPIGKPPLPRQKTDKVDGCPSAAFVLLSELFRDICVRSNCFDDWVFDEFGVCELYQANEGKVSSRGRAMDSIMAFMRRSSSDKAKSKGNGSFEKRSTSRLAGAGGNGLPDLCTTGLKSQDKKSPAVPTCTEEKIRARKCSDKVNANVLQNLMEGDNGANAIHKICLGLDGTVDSPDIDRPDVDRQEDMDIEIWRSETCSESSVSLFSDSCLVMASEENDVEESFWLDADTTILSQISSPDGNRTIEFTCDKSFTNSGILPSHFIAEEYFSSVGHGSASPDLGDLSLMIKDLSDIGL